MTIDVLFPYYGDVDLMKKAIMSVLRQSYTDFRLVVLDDGYPDESIPGWFASLNDPRVSYERNDTNLGANGNYRKAVTKIENEIAIVMGADDVMLPNYLQWVHDMAEQYPDVAVFQPGVFVIDENDAPSRTLAERAKDAYRPAGQGVRILSGENLATSLLRGNWLYFPSIAWRTQWLSRINFRPDYNVVQDLCLVLDITMQGGSLLLDDTAAFMYRRHRGSDSSLKALEGTRFTEEREFFNTMADEMSALGWKKASLTARAHLSSRLYAATLLPKALLAGNTTGIKNLARHVFR